MPLTAPSEETLQEVEEEEAVEEEAGVAVAVREAERVAAAAGACPWASAIVRPI
jgi:hypothetical protein